jgi:AcrR family transcriptional regulator
VLNATGVARSTVYVVFQSRAGLFDALAADLYDRAGYP